MWCESQSALNSFGRCLAALYFGDQYDEMDDTATKLNRYKQIVHT